ncbi:Protein tyrosine phosphatase-like protein PTPLA (contains Pro instead of catalytic Arg) [Phaffia rhodozyma]|uniref:Very-long-chain (3R)-3-hydroxyacyl-CoA dehydratase n=1 Tax=Phaffia rhodozyma TaxID=264483 RepID=A0A0F7SND3_PHARH|nr:Protein tyrosine phosphatase-like protein PTPLA (contains Pro instead of catalytic Arg) [Phaffia rhodozyma]
MARIIEKDSVKDTADRRKQTAGSNKARAQSPIVKYYLVAYNLASAAAWLSILVLIVQHVSSTEIHHPSQSTSPVTTALSKLRAYLSLASAQTSASKTQRSAEIVKSRLQGSYASIGTLTAVVQTCAVLEVVHSALGWVRSPVGTTISQVASRLWSVWAVVEQFESARTSSVYTTMVFAWSCAEIVRYLFYAFSLLGIESYPLLWLRYTLFYVLYPLGAGSEFYLAYSVLPPAVNLPIVGPHVRQVFKTLGLGQAASSVGFWATKMGGQGWDMMDLVRGGLLLVWPPSLYALYTYMISQRKKALGTGKKIGEGKKRV